jgi:hypothetical protein
MSMCQASTKRMLAASAAASLLLAACGGGVWLGFGSDDEPPHVSLVAPSSASAGQTVRLAAAASDDGFIDHVSFYRVDDSGSATLLGEDSSEPYEWNAVMPGNSGGSVRFFARAVDNIGQSTDSDTVSVTVSP